MIFQTDKEFPADIYHWGCFGMDIGERVSSRLRFPFTHELMIASFQDSIAADYSGAESFIKKPEQFANIVVLNGWPHDVAQGVPRIIYVGKRPASYQCAPYELEIQRWRISGADYDHFMSAQDGVVCYDSWSAEGSETHRRGKLMDKRVFRVNA